MVLIFRNMSLIDQNMSNEDTKDDIDLLELKDTNYKEFMDPVSSDFEEEISELTDPELMRNDVHQQKAKRFKSKYRQDRRDSKSYVNRLNSFAIFTHSNNLNDPFQMSGILKAICDHLQLRSSGQVDKVRLARSFNLESRNILTMLKSLASIIEDYAFYHYDIIFDQRKHAWSLKLVTEPRRSPISIDITCLPVGRDTVTKSALGRLVTFNINHRRTANSPVRRERY